MTREQHYYYLGGTTRQSGKDRINRRRTALLCQGKVMILSIITNTTTLRSILYIYKCTRYYVLCTRTE